MINLSTYNPTDNYIIFKCCDCEEGGIASRFIGLCSSFILALILNFKFKILWEYPIELDKLLDTKLYNWKLNSNIDIIHELKIVNNNSLTKYAHFLQNNINQLQSNTLIISNQPFYLYLLQNKNIDSRLKELNITNNSNIIGECMNILFALKPDTQLRYNKILLEFTNKYTIGLHLSNLLNTTNNYVNILNIYNIFVEENNIKYNNNLQLFITTDNEEIIKHIEETYPNILKIILNSKIINYKTNSEDNTDLSNNMRLILELWLLSKTNTLLINKNSNFAKLSCLINNKNPHIIDNNTYKLEFLDNLLI
tara:strand:+ start:693 stop:1619 length:927 start_codon:yes stop_codon:yes gene_type:complete